MSTVDIEFTDGTREQHPLQVDNTIPKGWMLITYTDNTATVHFGGRQRGSLKRLWWKRRWRIDGTNITAATPEELARHIAAGMRV